MKLVKTNKGVSIFNKDVCLGKLEGDNVSEGLYIIYKIEIYDNDK